MSNNIRYLDDTEDLNHCLEEMDADTSELIELKNSLSNMDGKNEPEKRFLKLNPLPFSGKGFSFTKHFLINNIGQNKKKAELYSETILELEKEVKEKQIEAVKDLVAVKDQFVEVAPVKAFSSFPSILLQKPKLWKHFLKAFLLDLYLVLIVGKHLLKLAPIAVSSRIVFYIFVSLPGTMLLIFIVSSFSFAIGTYIFSGFSDDIRTTSQDAVQTYLISRDPLCVTDQNQCLFPQKCVGLADIGQKNTCPEYSASLEKVLSNTRYALENVQMSQFTLNYFEHHIDELRSTLTQQEKENLDFDATDSLDLFCVASMFKIGQTSLGAFLEKKQKYNSTEILMLVAVGTAITIVANMGMLADYFSGLLKNTAFEIISAVEPVIAKLQQLSLLEIAAYTMALIFYILLIVSIERGDSLPKLILKKINHRINARYRNSKMQSTIKLVENITDPKKEV